MGFPGFGLRPCAQCAAGLLRQPCQCLCDSWLYLCSLWKWRSNYGDVVGMEKETNIDTKQNIYTFSFVLFTLWVNSLLPLRVRFQLKGRFTTIKEIYIFSLSIMASWYSYILFLVLTLEQPNSEPPVHWFTTSLLLLYYCLLLLYYWQANSAPPVPAQPHLTPVPCLCFIHQSRTPADVSMVTLQWCEWRDLWVFMTIQEQEFGAIRDLRHDGHRVQLVDGSCTTYLRYACLRYCACNHGRGNLRKQQHICVKYICTKKFPLSVDVDSNWLCQGWQIFCDLATDNGIKLNLQCGLRSGQKEVARELNPWRWQKVLILKCG